MRVRLAFAALLVANSGTSVSQSGGGDYTLRKSVVAGGTVEAVGGDFIVTVTAGQAEAGGAVSQGGAFRVEGGFWPEQRPDPMFANGFE